MIARAPGKMMWLGEYAVLEGAPAVVAAVDRYARVAVAPADEQALVFESPLFCPWKVAPSNATPDSVVPPLGAELVAAVMYEATQLAGPAALAPARYSLDTSELHAGDKLGLGSSSALAAALARALLPSVSVAEVEKVAVRAHRSFQLGRGSGSDVLAAVHGGLLVVHKGAARRVALPGDMVWAAIAVGPGADTRVLIDRVKLWRDNMPLQSGAHFAELKTASELGTAALQAGDTYAWLHAVEFFAMIEARIDRASGAGIFEGGVREAVAAAESAGWVAKPSGAGGGDVVVAFGDRNADIESLTRSIQSLGMSRLNVKLAPHGAVMDTV
jgi:phosphomevalonate kinase